MKVISHKDYFKKQMKKASFRKAHKSIEPEYIAARQIIELRLKRRMTQKQLAQKLKTKQPAISRIENHPEEVTLATLMKLADALDTRLEINFVKR